MWICSLHVMLLPKLPSMHLQNALPPSWYSTQQCFWSRNSLCNKWSVAVALSCGIHWCVPHCSEVGGLTDQSWDIPKLWGKITSAMVPTSNCAQNVQPVLPNGLHCGFGSHFPRTQNCESQFLEINLSVSPTGLFLWLSPNWYSP